VPIYWGDTPIESGFVFNRRRIIHYTSNEEVGGKVKRLMEDKRAREEWFREPVLKPSAHMWLAQWCSDARQLIREKWQELDMKGR